jgi:hypothetical protein
MMEELQMSIMGELTFLRYPCQTNEAMYLHTSNQVYERSDEEVQHG